MFAMSRAAVSLSGLLALAGFSHMSDASANVSANETASEVQRAFQDFIEKYSKEYETFAERALHYAVFEKSFHFVMAENAKGLAYKLELNQFADLSPTEFSSNHLGMSNPGPKKLFLRLGAGASTYLGTHRYSGASLPDSVDWSQKGAVTTPKNQGTCGSCWSFASTGALEGAWQIATGKLISLSEQQLVDCSRNGNQGCHGGSMDTAFEYLEGSKAVCTEASCPYLGTDHNKCCESTCTEGIPKGSVIGYKDVTPKDEQALMEAISKQPVAVAIEADQLGFQLYSKGVLVKEKCGSTLDHGVLAVGYGTTSDGVKYWKVKNSWGPQWGEGGFIRIERGNSADGADGKCGIKDLPVFPVVSTSPHVAATANELVLV